LPSYSKFNYAEKVEYWALVWGTIVMGITGILLWAHNFVLRYLPSSWLQVATAVHYYEAILATLAIVVWHFYAVIFDPDVYPLKWTLVSGRAPEHEIREGEDAEPKAEGSEGSDEKALAPAGASEDRHNPQPGSERVN